MWFRASLLITALSLTSLRVTAQQCQPNPQRWKDSVCCESVCPKRWQTLPLVVLSFDGFWYKYLNRNRTPNLDVLRHCGSSTPYMFASYPSKTFPNHYTIVTGLYPESHGIVDNKMYDTTFPNPKDREFQLKQTGHTNAWFRGEPIWNTATKNGLKSAALYWIGSELKINGMLPTYYKKFSERGSYESRIKQIVQWLKMSDYARPSIVLSYFDEPDETGHRYGPNSDEVNQQLSRLDQVIGQLMSSLFKEDILHCVNVVVLSDHGMMQIDDYPRDIHSYINTTGMHVFTGAVTRIMLGSSGLSLEHVRNKLKCRHSFHTYRTEEIPKRYHYANNRRIGDLLLDMVPGQRTTQHSDGGYKPKGDHGYDFKDDSMRTIFIASGPSFKKLREIPPFQNIQLYNLFADVTGMQIRAPNNGTMGALNSILKHPVSAIKPLDWHKPPYCSSPDFRSCGHCKLPRFPSTGQTIPAVVAPKRPSLCSRSDSNFRLLISRSRNMPSVLQTMLHSGLVPTSAGPFLCGAVYRDNWKCRSYSAAIQKLKSQQAALYPLLAFGHSAGSSWESFYTMVPMYDRFYGQVWQPVLNMLKGEVDRYEKVLTFVGPVYDRNANGLEDIAWRVAEGASDMFYIPTHYFVVTVACAGSWQKNLTCSGQVKAKSYVFQHRRRLPCNTDFEKFRTAHFASVRDVELLTGLRFLYNWNPEAATRVKLDLTNHRWM